MVGRTLSRVIGFAVVVALGMSVLAVPSQAAVPAAKPKAVGGNVELIFGPSFVSQMFKAGVFFYGASSVAVGQGDDGSLGAEFPLRGQSTATGTRRIDVDGEIGGISWYNGPAEALAGLGELVIRRAGAVGTVTAGIYGPYSAETGQFSQTLTVFTLSRVRTKATKKGWDMMGQLTMTAEAAGILNELLKTDVFQPGVRVGTLVSEVKSK